MLETLVGSIIGRLLPVAIQDWWVSLKKQECFKICFVNKLPPGEVEISQWGPHQILPGESQHYLRVQCSEALKIERFNVRFLDLDELGRDPYEPLIDIKHFIAITAISIAPRNLTHGIEQIALPDEKGGFDVLLKPPMQVAVREPFVLKISVNISARSWDGKISLRGHDGDGNRRYSRKDVRVSGPDSA